MRKPARRSGTLSPRLTGIRGQPQLSFPWQASPPIHEGSPLRNPISNPTPTYPFFKPELFAPDDAGNPHTPPELFTPDDAGPPHPPKDLEQFAPDDARHSFRAAMQHYKTLFLICSLVGIVFIHWYSSFTIRFR